MTTGQPACAAMCSHRCTFASAPLRSSSIAAIARAVTAITPMYTCRSSKEACTVGWAKGPSPSDVPQTAIPLMRHSAAVAPCRPKRNVAHTRMGMVRYANGAGTWKSNGPIPKTPTPSSTNRTSKKAASASRRGSHASVGRRLQARINEPAVKTPVMSPSHHVHQMKPRAFAGAKPPRYRLATPNVAATRHITIATPANANALDVRANGLPGPTRRRSRALPASACTVDPVAMPDDTATCAASENALAGSE